MANKLDYEKLKRKDLVKKDAIVPVKTGSRTKSNLTSYDQQALNPQKHLNQGDLLRLQFKQTKKKKKQEKHRKATLNNLRKKLAKEQAKTDDKQ